MYNLFIKQKVFKLKDQYEIYDDFGNPVYYVEEIFKFFGFKIIVTKIEDESYFVIEKKKFSLLPIYYVTFSDGSIIEIAQKLTFFKKEIELLSDNYSLTLVGDIWSLDFTVYDGEKKVGFIEKEFFSFADQYAIRVIDSNYEEELIALLIVVDNIIDSEQASSSSGS